VQHTSRTFVSAFADHSLLNATDGTDLSRNQAILLNSLIHRAHSVISLRPLLTGSAKDVAGVIRVTRGGAYYDFDSQDTNHTDWEMLYKIEDGRGKLVYHT